MFTLALPPIRTSLCHGVSFDEDNSAQPNTLFRSPWVLDLEEIEFGRERKRRIHVHGIDKAVLLQVDQTVYAKLKAVWESKEAEATTCGCQGSKNGQEADHIGGRFSSLAHLISASD